MYFPRNNFPPQTGVKVAVLIAFIGFAIALAVYPILQPALETGNTMAPERQAPSDR